MWSPNNKITLARTSSIDFQYQSINCHYFYWLLIEWYSQKLFFNKATARNGAFVLEQKHQNTLWETKRHDTRELWFGVCIFYKGPN